MHIIRNNVMVEIAYFYLFVFHQNLTGGDEQKKEDVDDEDEDDESSESESDCDSEYDPTSSTGAGITAKSYRKKRTPGKKNKVKLNVWCIAIKIELIDSKAEIEVKIMKLLF